MRIADHCGQLHADYVLAELTQEQLSDWVAYEQTTGPLGHDRNDIFWQMLLTYYVNTYKKEGSFPARFDDFDLYHVNEITDEDMEAQLTAKLGPATLDRVCPSPAI